MNYTEKIAGILSINVRQVQKTIELLESGATIPFIARYRKEVTGSLDEVQIAAIRDKFILFKELDKRRETIVSTISEQGKLTPELEKQIRGAETLTELEDIYLPYKPKRKTRATMAMAKGLEPLASFIFSQPDSSIFAEASKYIDSEKGVVDEEEALAGARDIIAEWINENSSIRNQMRNLYKQEAFLISGVAKNKEEEGAKYATWFDWKELAMKAPSHRILALFRGEEEGFLKVKIDISEEEDAFLLIEKMVVKNRSESAQQVQKAAKDSYKRLLAASMETEFRSILKEKADNDAIQIFAENLRQLLLASPLGQKNTLAIDPGFRTGCKIVCLNKQGELLHNETIYPYSSVREEKEAIEQISELVREYEIEAIAIGNGTAGRETEELVRGISFQREVLVVMVNESGASVYSASEVAREEFSDYDITVRGAVSIGRRLMDPLSELVKIDPKSIGVGQYQHDVNQQNLQKKLDDVVMSCVNSVGVELNTASKELLSYVSGIGNVLAKRIIEFRAKHGAFSSRKELLKVERFGGKAFEQSAGFLRIRNAKNPLDSSGVHPERYALVEQMAKQVGAEVKDLILHQELRKKIDIKTFVSENCGLPTLHDIMKELEKPGLDPRTRFEAFAFQKDITKMEDLHEGMVLPGIVTNITAFGAFVDIGVHQDGLVHISQLANRFVSDPNEVVKLQQQVQVKVLEVDIPRKRISLSMKEV